MKKYVKMLLSEFEYGGEIVLETAPLSIDNHVYLQITINGNDLTTDAGELCSSSILINYREARQLVYRLNEMLTELNKIHHGDCLELMKDIPDGSVDLVSY